MARSDTLLLLKELFPKQAMVSAVEAGMAISLARQTVRNKLCDGTFPIPTYLIGGKRLCKVTEIADFIDRIGQRPGRPRGATKAATVIARMEAERTWNGEKADPLQDRHSRSMS